MAVKTKIKSKVKPKARAKVATKKAAKSKAAPRKVTAKLDAKVKPVKKTAEIKAPAKVAGKPPLAAKLAVPVVKRMVNPLLERRRPIKKHSQRGNQFNFMKAPRAEYEFEVGDSVEVFCDHEKNRDRIRGWVRGIVVQVDHKLAAVQFRSNVYLTDGWMVPDRILWFPVNSENIRPVPGKKPVEKKEFIPDY
jgi:hypothetical protein